ncbi:hypothetical protein AB1N83_013716 [Pleurotus pulmonarius]
MGTHGTYEACQVPEGWKRYVHLDGSPYWYYKGRKDVNSALKFDVDILADVDLEDDKLLVKTEECIVKICNYIDTEELWKDLLVEENAPVQLVVETKLPEIGNDQYICSYYFACHGTRSIFWPQVNTMNAGYASLSHFRLDIEYQYWCHWEHFANIQVVTDKIYNELMNLLIYDITVQQTDVLSNAHTFTLAQLQNYIEGLKTTRGDGFTCTFCHGSPFLVGALMCVYKRRQFSTFWGESCARTRRNVSPSRTWLFRVISIFLFNAPEAYLLHLDPIFINNYVALQPWLDYKAYLHAEWQDFVLNSAVLLTANVAFLAIQSVDGKENDRHYRFPAQVVSYLSVLTSISSMLVGLLLAHNIRTKAHSGYVDALRYFQFRHLRFVRFEPLAIVYSLPYAFLIWAVISFMVAFLLVCFVDTPTSTRAPVGGVGLMCFVFVIGCVMMNSDSSIRRLSSFVDTVLHPVRLLQHRYQMT